MRFMRGAGPPSWAVCLANALWGKVSPFSVLQLRSESKCREMLNGYINRHQPVTDERERQVLCEYLFQILLRDSSTSIALFQQHDTGLHAYAPLMSPEKLCNRWLPFPVSFVYGSHDWMDSRGSREVVRCNQFFASGQSQLHILENAGHQLFMGNPTGFIQLITDDLLGRVTHRFQLKQYTCNYVDEQGNLTHTDTEFQEYRARGSPLTCENRNDAIPMP